MKHRLLNYLDDPALSGTERQACYFAWTEIAHRLNPIDDYPAAKDFPSTTMVTSAPARNSTGLVTDGPFAETHEPLGG